MIDPAVSAYYIGDCRKLLKQLPDGCVQVCVTSPPFWGLRDYEEKLQIGLEATPEKYVAELVGVFEEVWRVLRDDGTLWLNLGDTFANGKVGRSDEDEASLRRRNRSYGTAKHGKSGARGKQGKTRRAPGYKSKDLIGIPWMSALAIRDAGWYLRQDVIWSKPNPMPESVTDRCTRAHEYLFHFSKSASYYYDHAVIMEPAVWSGQRRNTIEPSPSPVPGAPPHRGLRKYGSDDENRHDQRNKRSVWSVASIPYDGAHFATYPPELIEPCILACSRPGDLVLDPFFGSGTTGEVAEKHERRWIGFDINPKYAALAKERTAQRTLPLTKGNHP